jgi:hypothetical protein
MRHRQIRIIPPIIQPGNLIEEDALYRHPRVIQDSRPVRIRIYFLNHLIDALVGVVRGHVPERTDITVAFQFRDLNDVGCFGFRIEARARTMV